MDINTQKSKDPTELNIEESDHLLENTDDADSPSLTKVPPLHLDEIFDRIGFGRYQLRLMILLGMVAATEGVQVTIGFLSFTILQNQREYSNTIQSFLITLNFIGMLAGGAAAGFFADKFGRRRPILTALTLITIFNFISGIVNEVAMFGLIRFLLGLFLGFSAPIGFTIVVENMPKVHRGKLVMMATACLFIGQLIGCILAFVTVRDLITGDYKLLVLWSTVVMFLVLALNYVYLQESIRYQLVMGHNEEAFKELDKIVEFNKKEGSAPLTKEEKDGLTEWAFELSVEIPNQEIGNFKALFRGIYKKTTLLIWLGYLIFSIVYYGIVLSLPYILQRISQESDELLFRPIYNSSDLSSITLSVLLESVSVVIAIFVVDTVLVDRAKMIGGFFFAAGLASLGAILGSSRASFILCATLTKIFINICSCFYYLITVEAYPTKYRAMGTGLATAVGKIGTIIMPWVFLPLAERFLLAPFILFVCLSLIGCASTYWFPSMKKGVDLK